MEKLELKHLAPYLPYGLKAEMLDCKIDYVGKQYDEIVGVHQWDKNCMYWSVLTIGGSKPNIERIKPILRPLSDLTKEIEVNGDRFVPMVSLMHDLNIQGELMEHEDNIMVFGWDKNYGDDSQPYSVVWDEEEMYFCCCYSDDVDESGVFTHQKLYDLPFTYRLFQKLLEWHFDVFNLIEKNLAIDLNSLK